MPLGTEVALGSCHAVLDGDPAPPSQKEHSSPLIFDQRLLWPTTGSIKMSIGTEVDLGPGDIVLDGDPEI